MNKIVFSELFNIKANNENYQNVNKKSNDSSESFENIINQTKNENKVSEPYVLSEKIKELKTNREEKNNLVDSEKLKKSEMKFSSSPEKKELIETKIIDIEKMKNNILHELKEFGIDEEEAKEILELIFGLIDKLNLEKIELGEKIKSIFNELKELLNSSGIEIEIFEKGKEKFLALNFKDKKVVISCEKEEKYVLFEKNIKVINKEGNKEEQNIKNKSLTHNIFKENNNNEINEKNIENKNFRINGLEETKEEKIQLYIPEKNILTSTDEKKLIDNQRKDNIRPNKIINEVNEIFSKKAEDKIQSKISQTINFLELIKNFASKNNQDKNMKIINKKSNYSYLEGLHKSKNNKEENKIFEKFKKTDFYEESKEKLVETIKQDNNNLENILNSINRDEKNSDNINEEKNEQKIDLNNKAETHQIKTDLLDSSEKNEDVKISESIRTENSLNYSENNDLNTEKNIETNNSTNVEKSIENPITRNSEPPVIPLKDFNEMIESHLTSRTTEESFKEVINVKITPPELGNIQIEIIKNGNAVTVNIVADDESSKNILSRTLQSLVAILRNNGYNPVEVKVETNSEQDMQKEEKEEKNNEHTDDKRKNKNNENDIENEFEKILRGE